MNPNEPKFYYSDARHQFCNKPPSLALKPLFYFWKNSKLSKKLEKFYIKDESSCLNILSCLNTLLSVRPILHMRKKFQTLRKIGGFFLNTHRMKFFQFIKFWWHWFTRHWFFYIFEKIPNAAINWKHFP